MAMTAVQSRRWYAWGNTMAAVVKAGYARAVKPAASLFAASLTLPSAAALLLVGCSSGDAAGSGKPRAPAPVVEARETSPPAPSVETASLPPTEGSGELPAGRHPLPEGGQPSLALGGVHSCALDDDGSVWCWGGNQFGQLADPLTPAEYGGQRSTPRKVGSLPPAVAIASGSFHSCVLDRRGSVRCWGHGGWGQLGAAADAGTDSSVPVTVPGLPPVVALALGEQHSCALSTAGEVYCWGGNQYGQLGVDDGSQLAQVPVAMPADGIVSGRHHLCALLREASADVRAVHCWGMGLEGQLGDGGVAAPLGYRSTPRAVVEPATGQLASWRSLLRADASSGLSAGDGVTCLTGDGGPFFCWGKNGAGQLATSGSRRPLLRRPHLLRALQGQELAFGSAHACFRNGTAVRCWGANVRGQLSDGSRTARRGPARALPLPGAVALAAGVHHSCALAATGGVYCWGANVRGQLGATTEEPYSTAPVQVEGLQLLTHEEGNTPQRPSR